MPDPSRPRLVRVAGRDAWHIYYQRHRISTGCTERATAEANLAQFIADLERPRPEAVSLSLILDRYLENRRLKGIPGLARKESAHKPLKRFWGQRPPEAVTEAECLAYQRRRATESSGPHGKAAGPATVRTELQALRAALRWAAETDLIAKAPNVSMPGRPRPRERWLKRDEADRLLAACHAPHVRLFILLGLHTAARAGAILALTWDRVDLEQRMIDFRMPGRTETRKRRVAVPINDTLHTALLAAHEGRTTDHVIEWAGGRILAVKHAFRQTATRAGLRGVTPHTLRHTAATWMAQAGVPLWEIAGLLGNTVEMVEHVYGHHSPEHLRRATRALG